MAQHRPRIVLMIAPLILGLVGCVSQPLENFAETQPAFRPEEYFAGHTHSWGVFEKRSGEPSKIIQTQTKGVREGDLLRFEQDIQIQGKENSHRTWLIRRLDEHHYSATGTGIVGTARGESRGNAFHLEFTLDAVPGNPLAHVHMSQWMYLQKDGKTMINRAIATKAGVILAEVTEEFHKDR